MATNVPMPWHHGCGRAGSGSFVSASMTPENVHQMTRCVSERSLCLPASLLRPY
jgi:hypothetical protein